MRRLARSPLDDYAAGAAPGLQYVTDHSPGSDDSRVRPLVDAHGRHVLLDQRSAGRLEPRAYGGASEVIGRESRAPLRGGAAGRQQRHSRGLDEHYRPQQPRCAAEQRALLRAEHVLVAGSKGRGRGGSAQQQQAPPGGAAAAGLSRR